MPINTNILLGGQLADISGAVGEGISAYNQARKNVLFEQQQQREAASSSLVDQLNKQKLEQATREADLFRLATAASLALDAIDRKDANLFKSIITKYQLPPDEIQQFSALADKGDQASWDALKGIASGVVETARSAQVFGRDYGLGASGYVSAGSQAIREAERLAELRKSGAITEQEYNDRMAILSKPTVVDVGGVKATLKPGETTATPVTVPGGPTTAPEIAATQAARAAEAKALEEYAKDFPAKEEGLKAQLKTFQNRADQIDVLMKTPGREAATGFERNLPGVFQRPGFDAQTYIAEYNKFKSGEFLTGVQQLRGFGSLSNAEGLKLESLLNSLTLETDDKTHYKTLQAIKDQTAKLIKTAEDELRAERLKMSDLRAAARGAVPPPPTPGQPKNVDLNAPIEPAVAPQKWFYDRTTKTYKKIGG